MGSPWKETSGSPHSDGVAGEAQDRLRRDSRVPSQRLSCEYRHGVLRLRGRLSSYYHKQVAQEAVKGVQGVAEVVNEIEVTE
jgi:osmotically-inducible protein OsmY